METRSHCKDTYKTWGRISWMDQDLMDCSADFQGSFKASNGIDDVVALRSQRKGRTLSCARFEGAQERRRHLSACHTSHICIIGAGLAGLRCAEVLIELDMRVTILEARDRIGGRISQVELSGRSIDIGPNWIHGTLTNPLIDICKNTGTSLAVFNEDIGIFDEEGRLVEAARCLELMEVLWNIISEAFKYSNTHCDSIPPNLTFKDFFLQQLDNREIKQEDKHLLEHMAEMWGAFIGSPWDKQSLKYFWLEECLDGENFFVANTYAHIVNNVAEKAQKHAAIQLNTKVTHIESCASISIDRSPVVCVETANGESLFFDEVIVTIPLGCLKRSKITFAPPLPTPIHQAVQNTTYGSLEKVCIDFPHAFWETSEPSSSPPFAFTQFLHPTYDPNNPNYWALEMNTLSSPSIFGKDAHPTLLFTVFGACGAKTSSLSKEQLIEFFKPYYSLLPNYSSSDPNCVPSAIHATTWQHDEFAGWGSYTNFQIPSGDHQKGEGEERGRLDDDIRALRKGVPERGIWLAGEHTAPFVAVGTTTGAYWSGEMVGMRVLRVCGFEGKVAADV